MTDRYPLLYLGYGANTNRVHMARRCPTARYLGNAELLNYRLIFRSVADVIPVKGQYVVCALWAIERADERALDTFEGFPHYYSKGYAVMPYKRIERLALFYYMSGNRKDRHEPPQVYEQTLREGYQQCGMPAAQINSAIRDAIKSEQRILKYRGKWNRDTQEQHRSSYSGLLPAVPRQQRLDHIDDLRKDYPEWPDWFIREYVSSTNGD